MKKAIAIVAILGILLQTFNQVVTVVGYYANKEYIVKNLCENRSRPKMHCDGKCCLKKKLAKDASQHTPSSRNQKENEITVLFFEACRFDLKTQISSPGQIHYFSYNDLHTAAFHLSIFHPPGHLTTV